MVSWVFLAVSLVGACFTVTALVRVRRLRALVVPYFFAAWLTGELAMHHVVWQAAATGVFVALGALERWPGIVGLAITVLSWIGLMRVHRRAAAARPAFERALIDGVGGNGHPEMRSLIDARFEQALPVGRLARPFKMQDSRVECVRNIPYGPAGKRNHLDVYRPRSEGGRRPTLVQIHGGAWVIGDKEQQGLPLMYRLAAQGWICVAANYQLSPKAAFPDHLIDVKRALAWVRRHGPAFGVDPDFIAVTGGSAGGHLATLAALTANDPELQPGFEEIDTTVAACVPFYGVYDFLDRHGVRGKESMEFFLRYVMKSTPATDREAWEKASPIFRVRRDAPPFFVIHGTHDSLAYVEDARHFVRLLREVSENPVLFAEIEGAQHAFDVFHSVRCSHAVNAVWTFLDYAYARHLRGRRQPVTAVSGGAG